MLKVGTDFSGIGAPEAALKRLGIPHEQVFACEIDKYARKSFSELNEPETFYNDITTRNHSEVEQLDLYVAGFPCQAFSLAGKRRGFDDTRGTLFFNVAEFIRTNQPKCFILENVKGLLSHDKGRTYQTIVDVLINGGGTLNGQTGFDTIDDGLGYHIYTKVLNTKNYGIPQNRERIFIVGFKDFRTFRFPKPMPLKLKLKDLLESEVAEKYYLSDKALKGFKNKPGDFGEKFKPLTGAADYAFCITSAPGTRITDNFIKTNSFIKCGYVNQDTQASSVFSSEGLSPSLCAGTHGYANGYVKCGAIRGRNTENPKSIIVGLPTEQMLEVRSDDCTNTLTSVQKDNVIVSDKIRKLTPLECWRLQGFTDEEFYKAQKVNSATQLYKQAGNSITVNVLVELFKKILQ